jgi:hypothetical protein
MSAKGVWASPNCIWGRYGEWAKNQVQTEMKKKEHGSTFATAWIREARHV